MRADEVYARLAEVCDPELDQPVTELGFVGGVEVDGPVVRVRIRLPTYWCAPGFAYIMAEDVRDRIRELPWVQDVEVTLQDHFAAGAVNEGVAGGKSFAAAFPGLADGNLEDLRWLFRYKAFLARQERVLRLLIQRGLTDEEIAGVTVEELRRLCPPGTAEGAQAARYLDMRRRMGLGEAPDAPAFVRGDGVLLGPGHLRELLREARRTRVSMDFNAELCRRLLEIRYGTGEAGPTTTP